MKLVRPTESHIVIFEFSQVSLNCVFKSLHVEFEISLFLLSFILSATVEPTDTALNEGEIVLAGAAVVKLSS